MVEKLGLPFPLLSDPDRSGAIEPYGVANPTDPRGLAHPAVIVVSPDGSEAYREVGRDFADRITEDELLGVVVDLGLPPTEQEPLLVGTAESGPTAMPVHAMAPYYRGARFAAVALGQRHPDIRDDTGKYIDQMDRYSDAVRKLRSG